MKLFSKTSEYAIRAMLKVAETDSFGGFSPKEICAEAEIPEPIGRKALAELVKAQIIQGTRGPGGGYNFLRDPGDISLLDVVYAVEGPYAFVECPMGLQCKPQKAEGMLQSCEQCNMPSPKCGLKHICPMHDLWKETRQSVIRHLDSTTLQDIRDGVKRFSSTGDTSS
jgi:Rrf2 family protein